MIMLLVFFNNSNINRWKIKLLYSHISTFSQFINIIQYFSLVQINISQNLTIILAIKFVVFYGNIKNR